MSTQAPNLVVHEWGTFLSMAGADGVTLDGMYHEEHALPGFVHSLSTDRLRVPKAQIKGETPVIYFYTPQPLTVRVRVAFPGGRWTHWYPQASVLGGQLPGVPRQSDLIGWKARLVPPTPNETLPPSEPGLLWDYARAVPEAATVVMDQKPLFGAEGSGERERFLFYRGLGLGRLPVVFSAQSGGTLRTTVPLRHIFFVQVEGNTARFRYLPALSAGPALTQVLAPGHWQATTTAALATQLQQALVTCGLFSDEAAAMVNTWRESYLVTPGLRVLFVLPQSWTDKTIPLTIAPRPQQVVRVMVGRIELLTPQREQYALALVRAFGSDNPRRRQSAKEGLLREGRYVEPILNRVRTLSRDPAIQRTCATLLQADWVRALRS